MYRVVLTRKERGAVTSSRSAKVSSFAAAVKQAVKGARSGYHASVDDTAQDDRRNRGKYGQREGYLLLCAPTRKKRKNIASCRFSTRGKQLAKGK